MKIQAASRIICLSIGLILFCSCAGEKRTVLTHGTSQILEDLTSDYFQKVLDRCQVEYRKKPKDAEILKQYLEVIEHIKVLADRAFQREDFAMAGSTYALLLKNFPEFTPFASRLSFDGSYLALRTRVSRTRAVEREAHSCLKTGSLQKAIDLYYDLHQQYPRDLVVQNSCKNILELIKTNGDLAFDNNDFGQAGSTYRILLKNFGALNLMGCSLFYDRELLNARIKKSQRKLFENGLEQYRAGNLELAISIWKRILAFDPENPAAKKAVDKATFQLRNLQKNEMSDEN
jgi:tetratricopeptide (TPR) repeat protein